MPLDCDANYSDPLRFGQIYSDAARGGEVLVVDRAGRRSPGGAGAGDGASEPIRVVTCSIHHAGSVAYVWGKVLLVKRGLY